MAIRNQCKICGNNGNPIKNGICVLCSKKKQIESETTLPRLVVGK